MPVKRIFLLGYFGAQNFGDDALLAAFLLEQREWMQREAVVADLLCGRHAPLDGFWEAAELEALIGERVSKRHALTVRPLEYRALIAPGGSLLQDVSSLKSLLFYLHIIRRFINAGVPVFLLNQGLGPFNTGSARALAPRLLKGARLLSLRDAQSAAWAEKHIPQRGRGEIVMSADPVLAASFALQENAAPASSDLLIMPRPCGALPHAGDPTLEFEALARFADSASTFSGLSPRFLPLHSDQDEALAEASTNLLKNAQLLEPRMHEHWASYIWDSIASAGLVLSFRLHGLIAAAALNRPAFGVAYDPKVEAFCREVGYPYCFPWEIHQERTQEMLARLWKERESVMQTVQTNKSAMLARYAHAQERFNALI